MTASRAALPPSLLKVMENIQSVRKATLRTSVMLEQDPVTVPFGRSATKLLVWKTKVFILSLIFI